MSRLVARILLAILMIPAAAIVYMIMFVANDHGWGRNEDLLFILSGAVTWLFIGVYWTLLWVGVVRMSGRRIVSTVLAALGAAMLAAIAGALTAGIEHSFGAFIGSIVAPIAWLIAATLLWRESPDERAERLRAVSKSAVVCPKCGYNLTGLAGTRCPECGTQYTLDELLAGQPSRVEADVPA